MAQEPSAHDEETEVQEQTPAAKAKSPFGIIKIILFVLLVIAGECTVAYWYLPSAAENAALAGSAIENKAEANTAPGKEAEKEKNGQVEVDMGEFNITQYMPTSNTTLRIDFHLFGIVLAGEKTDFMSHMEENLHRFREQVIVTIRSSEITDLTDAGLGLMKRKILDKTNRMLGKQFLQSVIFSDFSFIEQ